MRQSQVARVVKMIVQCSASETQGIIALARMPVTQVAHRTSTARAARSAPARITHAQKSQPGGTITPPGATALTVASMTASPSAATMLPRCGAMLRGDQQMYPSNGLQQKVSRTANRMPECHTRLLSQTNLSRVSGFVCVRLCTNRECNSEGNQARATHLVSLRTHTITASKSIPACS